MTKDSKNSGDKENAPGTPPLQTHKRKLQSGDQPYLAPEEEMRQPLFEGRNEAGNEPFLLPESAGYRAKLVRYPLLWFGFIVFVLLSVFWKMVIVAPSAEQIAMRQKAATELGILMEQHNPKNMRRMQELVRIIEGSAPPEQQAQEKMQEHGQEETQQ